jgi:hypothetical protein
MQNFGNQFPSKISTVVLINHFPRILFPSLTFQQASCRMRYCSCDKSRRPLEDAFLLITPSLLPRHPSPLGPACHHQASSSCSVRFLTLPYQPHRQMAGEPWLTQSIWGWRRLQNHYWPHHPPKTLFLEIPSAKCLHLNILFPTPSAPERYRRWGLHRPWTYIQSCGLLAAGLQDAVSWSTCFWGEEGYEFFHNLL